VIARDKALLAEMERADSADAKLSVDASGDGDTAAQ
jgi:hypothetical protein